jgi:uncharacterized protein with PIN domain
MDAAVQDRQAIKQQLLRQLAELLVEEQVQQGMFLETPHYSLIERQAILLGRELSQQAQARSAREVAAQCPPQVRCPTCQAECPIETQTREVMSLDGPVELTETVGDCPACRRSFFPSAGQAGARQPGGNA